MGTLTVQPGPRDTAPLWPGQRQPFSRLQIVPVEPIGLYLLSALGVEVGGVDEPTAVSMQLAAPKIIVRSPRGERLHRLRFSEPDPEEPGTLIPVVVLRYEYRSTVRSPGDDYRISFYRLRKAERRPRAIGGCGEHVGGRSEARPAPRDPLPVGRDLRREQRRDGEQGVEPEVAGQGNRPD